MELDQLVEKARQSTLFTAPVLGPDLERFLREQGPAIRAWRSKRSARALSISIGWGPATHG